MELQELRGRIDRIDDELVRLFAERMDVAAEVAAYKKEKGLPVLDASREKAKLRDVMGKAPEELQEQTGLLYSLLFELSRARQNRLLGSGTALVEEIAGAIENTVPLFPEKATVACQGVEGAYSQLACEKLFRMPNEFYFSSFEAVFSAIEKGLCDYGVIPLENSTAGSVNKVYDLMMKYNFTIVRSVRVKVSHCLLAKQGTKMEEIREIFSHEQAINQCGDFLKQHPDIKVTPCANTAMAARMVAESERRDIAALSSHNCAHLYGLQTLANSVQDKGNNYTRFICISKTPEIFPGANHTSIMLTTPHSPGALYRIIARISSLGVNLTKLESRPLPDQDFEFMFYFDLDVSVYSPALMNLMADLENLCETFRYLGSYSEII